MKFSRSLVLKITYKCTSNIVPWYQVGGYQGGMHVPGAYSDPANQEYLQNAGSANVVGGGGLYDPSIWQNRGNYETTTEGYYQQR